MNTARPLSLLAAPQPLCRGPHLTVGCTDAGHLLVEFIQFCLELLQLLALGVHAVVVLAIVGR